MVDAVDRVNLSASSDADEHTQRFFERGREAWPATTVDFESFQRYFTRHAGSETPPSWANAADMYLACACTLGRRDSLAALDRILEVDVKRRVASVDSSPAFVEEILQDTRAHLLVRRDDGPGRMVEYGGRASLKKWLSAVAVRLAIRRRQRKSEQRHCPLSEDSDRRLAAGGPEFDYLRGRYKSVFEDAVCSAIEALPSKERLLLRLNLVEGMSIDRLATMYAVGRSTAARWLAKARDALLERVRDELRAKLRLSAAEFESLGADMRSQLDVSILRLLAQSENEQPET